jgi:predicted transcriptional regulator
MAKRLPHITAAELRILKVLWRLNRKATVRDVRDELEREGPDNPAYTTVMTLMNQLAAKKALEVDKDRQPYLYRALLKRESVLRDRIEHFISSVFDGQAGELVLHLVEAADLSPDDLKRIEARIEAREREEQDKPTEGNP